MLKDNKGPVFYHFPVMWQITIKMNHNIILFTLFIYFLLNFYYYELTNKQLLDFIYVDL